jgi:hypothetical protein
VAWRTIGQGLMASALVLAGVAGSLPQGCKKKQQETAYPPQPPPTATADAAVAPPPAFDGAAPDAAAAGPVPLDAITNQSMQDFIRERAKKQAKGMKPHGDFFGAVVEEGGTVEQTIMIDAGKCYGVIAMGSPSVGELDIQIQAKPGLVPLPGPVIAVDSNTGPEAAVSPCWKNPFPLSFPAVVVLKATRGSGPIGGQTFVK